MSSPASLPQTRVGRAPWIVAGAVFVLTATLLISPTTPVARLESVLPAFFAVVVVGNLLTSVILVEHYRAGGGPRLLALSWAYVFSGALVIIHTLVFPGIVTQSGLFGGSPSSSQWLWVAWHTGFPVLVGFALAPWPRGFKRWVEGIDRRGRRIGVTHGVILMVVVGIGLLATVGDDLLPTIIVGSDYSVLTRTYGPWIAALNVYALAAAAIGVVFRTEGRRGVETWALVAVMATACDAVLILMAENRYTVGWYGARAMAVTASLVVLISMLVESAKLQRRLRTYAHQLTLQNDELLEAQGLRDHLVAVVTHEMRTPLGGLRGYLEVLQDGDLNGPLPAEMEGRLPQGVRRAQDRCLMLTQRLTLLTEDLLAVASAKSGGLVIRPENADLTSELNLCIAGFPDIDLRIECPDTITVRVDPLRLQQVLANLVGNAAKYGAEPVTIHASTHEGMALIEVSDAGDGVPEEFVPYLFERYSRAPGTTAMGSGLGLSVVRDLVALHGGSVTYVSDGHVFEVRLPLVVPAEAPSVPVEPSVRAAEEQTICC